VGAFVGAFVGGLVGGFGQTTAFIIPFFFIGTHFMAFIFFIMSILSSGTSSLDAMACPRILGYSFARLVAGKVAKERRNAVTTIKSFMVKGRGARDRRRSLEM
jgi:hypothetical protein